MGGSITYDELKRVLKGRKFPQYFVETGTYHGFTARRMAPHFKKVYTMEIVPQLYEYSKSLSGDFDNIEFLLGDSVKLLESVTPKVVDGAIFFIDAHQSGDITGNNGTNVPLLDELDVILRHNVKSSVFIIDDLRLWKAKVWDWAHVTNRTIINKFVEYGYTIQSCFEENDRLYLFTL